MSGGLASRRKGAEFEREIVALFRESGWLGAKRTSDGRAQMTRGDITGAAAGYYWELKRQEKLNVPAAFDQISHDAPLFTIPVLVHRPSRHYAMATLPLVDLLPLIWQVEHS